MIGYMCLGTNDLARAAAFYDALLADLGAQRTMQSERYVFWGSAKGAMLGLIKPANGEPATVGNGVMAAIAVKTPAEVDALYAKALALGGTDEGPAGPRGGGFYAGYFRDLEGNKLNVFCMG